MNAVTNTAPRTSRPVAKTGTCECGCGRETKSWFAPGHDARLHGRAKRFTEGRLDLATLVLAEADAVRSFLANEKLPPRIETTSFVPQEDKNPAIRQAEIAKAKHDAAKAKVERLKEMLKAAQEEEKALRPAK